jgi:MSHA biogenesis protein MshJ
MKQLTQYWKKLSARVDALTLRERAMLFAMAAALIIFTAFFFFLNPAYTGQKLLLQTMGSQQDNIAGVENEITQTITAHSTDPDAAERARLQLLRSEAQALRASLTAMQQGMVPAERMTGLLGQILRSQRNLKLVSMRTLREGEGEPAPAPVPNGAAPPPSALLHKHGVEVVVQGSYADMVAYLDALEAMHGQIFWGGATMKVDSYPKATLTLVVYTVNLDKKWVQL